MLTAGIVQGSADRRRPRARCSASPLPSHRCSTAPSSSPSAPSPAGRCHRPGVSSSCGRGSSPASSRPSAGSPSASTRSGGATRRLDLQHRRLRSPARHRSGGHRLPRRRRGSNDVRHPRPVAVRGPRAFLRDNTANGAFMRVSDSRTDDRTQDESGQRRRGMWGPRRRVHSWLAPRDASYVYRAVGGGVVGCPDRLGSPVPLWRSPGTATCIGIGTRERSGGRRTHGRRVADRTRGGR